MSTTHTQLPVGSSDCIDGEIRLVGGLNESDGVVEICFGRTWGRIRACDDRWNDSNARVICGQLGYLQDNGRCINIALKPSNFKETHQHTYTPLTMQRQSTLKVLTKQTEYNT